MAKIKLSTRVTLPESVKKMQAEYKNARKGLIGKAYSVPLKKRFEEMKKDFKVHKAVGVLFSFLGLRLLSDLKKMKSKGIKEIKVNGMKSRLDAIGYALAAEMSKNPALRKSIDTLAKTHAYLTVDKKGEIFLTSYSGSVLDESTVTGKIFGKSGLIPPARDIYLSNQTSGQRLELKTLLALGSPKYESASASIKKGKTRSAPKTVTVAGYGDNEIRIFTPAPRGGVSAEQKILASETQAVHLFPIKTDPTKMTVKIVMKNRDIIRIVVEKEKARKLVAGFKLKN
jgi:hypothetical protein